MTLIRWTPRSELARSEWDPFTEFRRLQDEMMKLFDTSYGRGGFDSGFFPALDISEDKDSVIVTVDLPGIKKDEIGISLQDNVLYLRGERKQESEKTEGNVYRSERIYGSFSRSVALPMSVNANKVEATFKDGVLRITMPKSEEAKPKQIKVNVA